MSRYDTVYRNTEGYHDPTAGEVIRKIMHEKHLADKTAKRYPFRPLVYICSPFSGDIERNTETACKYSRFAVNKGYIPIAPHLLFPQFMNDRVQSERELGMFFGHVLMDKCAQVWVFGSNISDGMKTEIERAERKRYVIKYFSDDCKYLSGRND